MKLAVMGMLLPLSMLGAACTKGSTPDDGKSATASETAAASAISGTESVDPTANEISNYKLDMDKMRKYVAAIKGFTSLSKSDSAAASAMSTDSNESTAQMIAKLESNPAARRVLSQAGLSAKDYVWITAAWLQAAMTQGVLAASPQAKMPPGQNPENIQFLEANKVELDRIMKEAGMSQ